MHIMAHSAMGASRFCVTRKRVDNSKPSLSILAAMCTHQELPFHHTNAFVSYPRRWTVVLGFCDYDSEQLRRVRAALTLLGPAEGVVVPAK